VLPLFGREQCLKKLLFITYVFPPTGGAGIQRNVKFIKYLSRMGWKITVLTPRNPSVPTKDASFSKDIPPNVDVVYTRTFEPDYSVKQKVRSNVKERPDGITGWVFGKLFQAAKIVAQSVLLPDIQILWSLPSFPEAVSLVKRKKIDVIFASAPPFSSLVFASWLSKVTGVPYVADFRDEWVDFIDKHYDSHRKIFGKGIVRSMERGVALHAAAVTMASPAYVENLCGKYRGMSGKVHALTNGFDVEDYADNEAECHAPRNERMVIAYFGSVIKANTAQYFLGACKKLLDRNPEYRDMFEIHFAGRISDDEVPHIESHANDVRIVRHGYLEHGDVIRKMKESDVLLILVDDLPGAERMISGKIFEYLYARKAILAVVPQEGEVDRIVRDVDCGISCPPRDLDNIGKAVETLILRWKQETLDSTAKSNESLIQAYSREVLASRLSQILTNASHSA
jgi:glycosyltransferase involved in cell wall biosynthesis